MSLAARLPNHSRPSYAVFFIALLQLITTTSLVVYGQVNGEVNGEVNWEDRIPALPASMIMQPTPLLEPRINVAEDSRTADSAATASRL